MKKLAILIGIILIGAGSFLVFKKEHMTQVACTKEAKLCSDGSAVGRTGPQCEFAPCPEIKATQTNNDLLVEENVVKSEPEKVPDIVVPLDKVKKRVTKKPFGIFITPKDSPVQPEKFRGYHTGIDYEVFPEEMKADVSVRAVCPGTIAVKRSATGYGGVIVERCELGGGPVTVVYGHLALGSVTADIGESVEQGDVIGVLGTAGSADTDSERKHLHLGIHKGEVIDIRGYVAEQKMLDQWLDPCEFFCK